MSAVEENAVKIVAQTWEYVPSTEHHGPYVTDDLGLTICDCYVMSNPASMSTRNGGVSRPIHHRGEFADGNARLIAAAPDLLGALKMWLIERGEWLEEARAAIAKAEGRT